MENKPLKRNDNIVKLSRDHHASLLFCWKLRQGVKFHTERQRMIKYVQYFWDHHFSIHFKEEEEFLFAPLQDEVIQKAMEDHEKIRIFIEQIVVERIESESDILLELADMVEQHVRYEERILFPHLQEKLSEEQLETIGKKISGETLTDNYDDEFWIKSSSL